MNLDDSVVLSISLFGSSSVERRIGEDIENNRREFLKGSFQVSIINSSFFSGIIPVFLLLLFVTTC